jgi:HD superfamily phosphohydrolase
VTVPKHIHEIRDPVHVFIRLDNHEREVLNSRPFQRLRHIHQLALTYLVYPGATHKRFEHSLGVMELSSRVFDVVTNPDNVLGEIRSRLRPLGKADSDELRYWRRVLRMAALCHDIGHMPFSHAAEDLLPGGWDHERVTQEIIASNEMKKIWENMTPPLRHEDIIKLTVGPKKVKDFHFSDWEAILSEIIVGDAFGVDRMDYLLRDSHHLGVAYGKFDHYRLIDTLQILPTPSAGNGDGSGEPTLGVNEGGIQSAEALMVARYFIYSQVYFHPVRRIYDIHLKDFFKDWLPRGLFSTDIGQLLSITDNEVTVAFLKAAFDSGTQGHTHARRIVRREHFKRLYERNPTDVQINPEAGQAIFEVLRQQFGADLFRRDRYSQKGGAPDFPVRMRDGRIVSSLAVSEVLNNVPVLSVDYVFAERGIFDKAEQWLKENREKLIEPKKEEANDG